MKSATSDTDSGYLRGLLGARLANKDHWILVMGGSRGFVTYIEEHMLKRKPMRGDMLIGPYPIIAGDIRGQPEIWLEICIQTKEQGTAEAQKERRGVEGQLKALGMKGVLSPEQDIFILLEPDCPSWAGNLVTNFLEWIRTGEGEIEVTRQWA